MAVQYHRLRCDSQQYYIVLRYAVVLEKSDSFAVSLAWQLPHGMIRYFYDVIDISWLLSITVASNFDMCYCCNDNSVRSNALFC